MANDLHADLQGYRHRLKQRKAWHKVLWVLGCITVFCTTYALILPAITMEVGDTLYCGKEEHQHTEACYNEGELVCTLEEHTHSLACYSDPEADVETAEAENGIAVALAEDEGTPVAQADIVWTAEEQKWIDNAAGATDDLVAVAITQLDYVENENGYTIYEKWCGGDGTTIAEDWGAMFLAFCMDNAGISADAFPRASSCADLIKTAKDWNDFFRDDQIRPGEGPQASDIAFLDFDNDGVADHIGIIENNVHDVETNPYYEGVRIVTMIVANSDGKVERKSYHYSSYQYAQDVTVLGYAKLPTYEGEYTAPEPEPEPEPEPSAEWTLFSEDESITANVYQCTYDGTVTDRNKTHYIPGEPAALTISGAAYKRTSSKTVNGTAYQYHEYLIPLETVLNQYSSLGVNTGVDLSTVQENDASPFMSGRSKETFTGNVMKGNATPGNMWDSKYPDEIANALTAGNYVLKDGTWYLQVRATETSGNPDVLDIYYAVLEQETNTVSPASSSINLFDYWIDSRDARDIFGYDDAGINYGHAIKFFWSNNDVSIKEGSATNTGVINTSAQEYNNGVVQGIVQNKLVNGYPVLSGNLQNGGNSTESLDYLFDPKTACEYRTAYTNVKGLLQAKDGYYCFDAEKNAAEYDESTNRFNLYTTPVMAAGGDSPYGQFFPFEDAHQAALESSVCDDVQHYFGMALTAKFIQQNRGTNDGEPVTFEFTGDDDVWIFIDDVLVADLGGVHSQCGVTINFQTGDVTITGVQGVSTDGMSITDSNTVTTTTLKQQFVIALGSKNLDASDWRENTFADDTTHTLKFFYLERGNWDSSLSLRYNLVDAPPTSIYKVDQYGEALVGATFATYAAEKVTDADGNVTAYKYKMDDGSASQTWQADWYLDTTTGDVYKDGTKIITATYHGTTDSNGEMQFVDEYGGPFTEKELKQTLTGDANGGCFILREISIPDGYRTVSAETWLSFSGSNIICDNTYQSGVWASPNALVTATNELHVADAYSTSGMTYSDGTAVTLNEDDTIPYYNVNDGSKGTLFAVVLKRDGNSLNSIDTWDPLYGNDVDGYTVLEDGNETNNLANAIAAAQAQQANPNDHSVVFTESASGMQALLEDLPGKITRYYTYMQEQNDPDKLLTDSSKGVTDADPQYFVAYYWTSANSLDGANETNTVRVVSRSGIETGYDGFDVQWGTTLEVPNMENRLFFQKLNEDGALVDGAVFALYEAYDAPKSDQSGESYIYYVGDDGAGGKVYVGILTANGKDSDGNPIQSNAIPGNSGAAIVFRATTDSDGKDSATLIGRGIYEINTTGVSVDPTDGTVTGTDIGLITVTVNGEEYYVRPVNNAKDETLVGATHDTCEYVTEVGTGHFIQLASGKYYLREIYAPEGYELNTTDIPVLVNNNGVYANALEAGDGVVVGNGTGYLTKTLDVFASPGEIDETLTWVYAALLQNTTTGFAAFDEVSGDVIRIDNDSSWSFVTKSPTSEEPAGYGDGTSKTRDDAMLTYLVYDGKLASKKQQELIFDYVLNTGHTDGEQRLRLYTDEGWSDLAIYQDYTYGYANRSNKSSGDTAANTTYYEDLTGLGNISNLFSSSTFVQVTDQADGMVDLAIKKTDSSEQPLAGASFRLMQETEKDDGYYVYDAATQTTTWVKNAANATTVETDENGVCNFHGLKAGTYYLEEISAPAGYMARTETIKVVVTSVTKSTGMELVMAESSEATGITPEKIDAAGKWLGILVDANDNEAAEGTSLIVGETGHYRYTLIIPNNKDYRLPNTGGTGTTVIYLVGALLLLSSGILFAVRKRR